MRSRSAGGLTVGFIATGIRDSLCELSVCELNKLGQFLAAFTEFFSVAHVRPRPGLVVLIRSPRGQLAVLRVGMDSGSATPNDAAEITARLRAHRGDGTSAGSVVYDRATG